jgi:hypothetical protein
MTRKAKEKRQERVLEKQRLLERRLQREQTLSGRADWRALLRRIDGDDAAAQAVVSPRHRIRSSEELSAASSSRAKTAVAETVQWKSTNVPVAAAGVFQLPIQVDAPRATLTYEFGTQDFDLSFGIHAVSSGDGGGATTSDLVPVARYDCHLQRVRGSLVLAGPALVVLVWDNTFSWLNTKQLAYSVELHQEFPEPVDLVGTPQQRAALALHERAKRERLRAHRATSCVELEAARESHDQKIVSIEQQIEELRQALEEAEAMKAKATQEKEAVEEEMEALTWEIDGTTRRHAGRVMVLETDWLCFGMVLTSVAVAVRGVPRHRKDLHVLWRPRAGYVVWRFSRVLLTLLVDDSISLWLL